MSDTRLPLQPWEIDKVKRDLVIAVQRAPHYFAAPYPEFLSGDEPHAEDCPGCALTRALTTLQELTREALGA